MRILRKTLSILLALTLICSAFAVIPAAAETAELEANIDIAVPEKDGGDITAPVRTEPSVKAIAIEADNAVQADDPAPAEKPARSVDLADTGTAHDLAETSATEYPLVVGTTQVTSDNCNDILKDGGKAKYNPSTRTLTLNNPTITAAYGSTWGAIQLNDTGHFTVTGTFHMKKSLSEYGLQCPGSVTLSGDFTFYGTDFGVGVQDTLTVASGSLKGVATNPASVIDSDHAGIGIYTTGENNSKMIVNEGVTKIEAIGNEKAIQTDDFQAEHFKATSPVGAYYISSYQHSSGEEMAVRSFVLEDLSGVVKSLVVEPYYGTDYNVWVGARRVTSENKGDIFGDGKASFEPNTKTLTLNNPTLNNYYKKFGRAYTYQIYSEDSLTIKGTWHMPEKAAADLPARGVHADGYLTFDGDFTFRAQETAVIATNDITVASGSLTAVSTGYKDDDKDYSGQTAVGSQDGAIIVKSGVTKVDAQSTIYPLYAQTITLEEHEEITTPKGGLIAFETTNNWSLIAGTDGKAAKHVVIEYSSVVHYGIWLALTEVTSENKNDILGDGKANYDPTTNTLTLNNPTINGYAQAADVGQNSKIFCDADLTIKGSYTMPDESDITIGLFSNESLTLAGNFTFKGTDTAVHANGSISVNSGSLTADSDDQAVFAGGDFAVNAGSVTAISRGDGAIGIQTNGTFIVGDGVDKVDVQAPYPVLSKEIPSLGSKAKITTPENPAIAHISSIGYYTIIQSPGTIVNHVVIEYDPTVPVTNYDVYVGSTRVTSKNKDDVLNDGGKVKYDPDTKTLTLSDPDITDTYENNGNTFRIFSYSSLTLKGSYTMAKADAKIGVYSNGSLTLDGSFTFKGTSTGVYSEGDITVSSGSLTAVGGSSGRVGVFADGTFSVLNDVTKVDMEGSVLCVRAEEIDLGDALVITSPVNGKIIDPAAIYQSIGYVSGSICDHAVIENKASLPTEAPTDPPTEAPTNPPTGPPTDPPTEKPTESASGIDLKGEGSKDAPYLIETTADWNKLAEFVTNGGDTLGKYFRLENNISVSTSVGKDDKLFKGTFDGSGKTLTVNLSGDADTARVAPFSNVYGATIKNLKVDGTVTGGLHCSGLIGGIAGGAVIVEYCEVAVDIDCLSTHCGGFIGHAGDSVTAIHDSVFTGSISSATLAGTFWGWSESDSIAVLANCLDLSDSIHPIGRGFCRSSDLTNNYYVHKDKKTDGLRAWNNIGKPAFSVTDKTGDLSLTGRVGIAYGGKIYAAEGETVSMQSKTPDGTYSANAGTLTQNGADLTLVMPAQNVTITRAVNGQLYHDYYDANGKIGNAGEGAENLVDNNVETKWCASTSNYPISMTFRTRDEVIVSGYEFTTAKDTARYPGRNPVSWTIEASKDGENWTTLTDVDNDSTLEAKNYTPYRFGLTDPSDEAYSYFRFTVKATAGGGTFQLSELQLLISGIGYDLWLGDTQVTSINRDDILKDGGKAKFDPDTETLTLDDPTITGQYKDVNTDDISQSRTYKIYSNIQGLKLKGSCHMTDAEADIGIFTRHGITLDGDFTFKGNMCGVLTLGNLTFSTGSVKAVSLTSEAGYSAIHSYSGIDIKDGITKIEAEGGATAIRFFRSSYTLDDKFAITTPEDGYFGRNKDGSSTYVVYNPDDSFADHVVIQPAELYDLRLGKTQVTSGNKNDILKDGGKAKFDPKTNTLTLHDPTIDGIYTDSYDYTYKIYSGLSLTVKGSYHMTSGEPTYGIGSDEHLTLDGDFTFMGNANGIHAAYYLTLVSGNIKGYSDENYDYSIGIYSNWGIFVKEGVSSVEAKGKRNSIVGKTLEVDGGLTVTAPEGGSVGKSQKAAMDTVLDSGGSDALHAVIKDDRVFNVWVGSTQVTGMNKNDILGDGGKAVYTPSTSTLTLNEPDIKDHYNDPTGQTYKIHSKGVDLTVKGSYHMTEKGADIPIRLFDASLTLAGDFTLIGELQAAVAGKDVTIASGTLKAVSDAWRTIKADGTLTFGDDVEYVEITSDPTANVCNGEKGIVLSDHLYVADPAGNDNWAKTEHVVIKRRLLGDVDGDGNVTILDATYIQRKLAGIKPKFAFNEAAADADGDGHLTIFDATYIQRWLAGMPSSDKIGQPM